jgi:hypothetical protein
VKQGLDFYLRRLKRLSMNSVSHTPAPRKTVTTIHVGADPLLSSVAGSSLGGGGAAAASDWAAAGIVTIGSRRPLTGSSVATDAPNMTKKTAKNGPSNIMTSLSAIRT